MGVSKHMTRTQARKQTRGKGTDLWMAPEVQDTLAKGEQPTYGHPIDVFGFGLTAVFILTRREWLGRLGKKIDGEKKITSEMLHHKTGGYLFMIYCVIIVKFQLLLHSN